MVADCKASVPYFTFPVIIPFCEYEIVFANTIMREVRIICKYIFLITVIQPLKGMDSLGWATLKLLAESQDFFYGHYGISKILLNKKLKVDRETKEIALDRTSTRLNSSHSQISY